MNWLLALLGMTAGTALTAANNAPDVPLSVLVTVEAQKSAAPVGLTKDEVRVRENGSDRQVLNVKHLAAGKSQLLLMIDDSAGGSFSTQIPDLKKFITSLPADEEVAVGYMHNGTNEMTSPFTLDHQKAASSIRLPLGTGGADVSPYDSLAEAAKRWPKEEGVVQRNVVMITSGIEGLGGGLPPENPYVNAGIEAAQKAGLTVYGIYNSLAGHEGHSMWRATWGQNFLSQLTDETGGEMYAIGFTSAVSYEPFLSDILKRQSDQYVVSFGAKAENKSEMQPLKIQSTVKGISIAAPDKVFVKASM